MKHISICVLTAFLCFFGIYCAIKNIDINYNLLAHMLCWMVVIPILFSIGLIALARLIEILQGNIDPEVDFLISDNMD